MEDVARRTRFRQAGRRVLRNHGDLDAHEARVLIACELDGAEPVQGALADMAHAGAPDERRFSSLLQRPEVGARLSAGIIEAFEEEVRMGLPLPRVSRLATRYSILAMPSLDVPTRAIRCGVDDSRRAATAAIPALLAGDAAAEAAFLDHCEGALDTLAFMLARSALIKARRELSPRWRTVSDALQQGAGA